MDEVSEMERLMRGLDEIDGEAEMAQLVKDAMRYRHLRSKDLDTIQWGGVFAGMTPDNFVLNGEDLDREVDAEMEAAT